ncbi:hypothetical protein [Halorientalis sp. IM1011]|uniref:hypothetical protein n=1 Tax=Halorientalis sp. IM1011 TaxID=1932360 RepID=UPI0012FB702F|nr:hypothetical protein [Halorientalis sp. IM1011]
MTRESSSGSLPHSLAHLPQCLDRLWARLRSNGLATPPSSVRQPATAAHAPIETGTVPPFETITVAETEDCSGSHGVTIWNEGPTRFLTVSIESAGRGHLFETERRVYPDRPLRVELEQADAYTVAVGDGDLLYEITVDPAWFDRDAAVTDVVVDEDGKVRYSSLAERDPNE